MKMADMRAKDLKRRGVDGKNHGKTVKASGGGSTSKMKDPFAKHNAMPKKPKRLNFVRQPLTKNLLAHVVVLKSKSMQAAGDSTNEKLISDNLAKKPTSFFLKWLLKSMPTLTKTKCRATSRVVSMTVAAQATS